MDTELRRQITFHKSQRGFIKGLPGAHVNARMVDALLRDAKSKKGDCAIAFLDVSGAFDNVGHEHIVRSLEARGVSHDLKNAISALLCSNKIRINVGAHATGAIDVLRGVPQGGPLSSSMFNLAIDHLYHEVCDHDFSENYGYKLGDGHDSVILTGFADDQAVSARGVRAGERVIDCVQRRLAEIGLDINPRKSTAIVIINGELRPEKLHLGSGDEILSMG